MNNKGLLVTSSNSSKTSGMNKLQNSLLQTLLLLVQIFFSRSSKHKPFKSAACKILISSILITPGSTEEENAFISSQTLGKKLLKVFWMWIWLLFFNTFL